MGTYLNHQHTFKNMKPQSGTSFVLDNPKNNVMKDTSVLYIILFILKTDILSIGTG